MNLGFIHVYAVLGLGFPINLVWWAGEGVPLEARKGPLSRCRAGDAAGPIRYPCRREASRLGFRV